METRSPGTSLGEFATGVGTLGAGTGVITLVLLPLAVPALLLVVVPVAVVAAAGMLLAAPLAVPLVRRKKKAGSAPCPGPKARLARFDCRALSTRPSSDAGAQ
jgi:hypothetical protein